MSKITYEDKEQLNTNENIPANKKCMASDLNEIKEVVNENDTNALYNTNVKTAKTNSDTDVYSCNYVNTIIESGSNDNGSYIKFDKGIIVEFGRNGFECSANSYKDKTITLPISTIKTMWAGITMQSTSSSSVMGSITLAINSFNTNSLTIRAFNDTSSDRYPDGFWVVIGTWE